MKVIFLDFDGVLNSMEWWRRCGPDARDGEDTSKMLDPAAVGLVNQIVRRTGAKVVISSSWRILASMRAEAALKRCGFVGEILGKTPNGATMKGAAQGAVTRGHEIQRWLDENPGVTDFVILDDDSDMAHLKNRLVKTQFATGLTQAEADTAVVMLGGQPPKLLEPDARVK